MLAKDTIATENDALIAVRWCKTILSDRYVAKKVINTTGNDATVDANTNITSEKPNATKINSIALLVHPKKHAK